MPPLFTFRACQKSLPWRGPRSLKIGEGQLDLDFSNVRQHLPWQVIMIEEAMDKVAVVVASQRMAFAELKHIPILTVVAT